MMHIVHKTYWLCHFLWVRAQYNTIVSVWKTTVVCKVSDIKSWIILIVLLHCIYVLWFQLFLWNGTNFQYCPVIFSSVQSLIEPWHFFSMLVYYFGIINLPLNGTYTQQLIVSQVARFLARINSLPWGQGFRHGCQPFAMQFLRRSEWLLAC